MKLIPQAFPFVMIDELLDTDDRQTRTSFLVKEGHLFVAGGVFTEPGLMENMAQTAAAGEGYLADKEGKAPPVGFIGAIKNWTLDHCPPVGSTLMTTINKRNKIGNAQLVTATVTEGDRVLASAEFTIFLQ